MESDLLDGREDGELSGVGFVGVSDILASQGALFVGIISFDIVSGGRRRHL